MNPSCVFCGTPVDPRRSYQRVVGWQRIAGVRASGAHGGSDISLRETRDEWCCDPCMAKLRNGIHPEQRAFV